MENHDMKRSAPQVPSLSTKEYLILTMLISKPRREKYGLELVNLSEGQLKRGTIYVTLSRMEDKRFIESYPEESLTPIRGIPRRLYRVTGLGETAYKARTLVQRHIQCALNPIPVPTR